MQVSGGHDALLVFVCGSDPDPGDSVLCRYCPGPGIRTNFVTGRTNIVLRRKRPGKVARAPSQCHSGGVGSGTGGASFLRSGPRADCARAQLGGPYGPSGPTDRWVASLPAGSCSVIEFDGGGRGRGDDRRSGAAVDPAPGSGVGGVVGLPTGTWSIQPSVRPESMTVKGHGHSGDGGPRALRQMACRSPSGLRAAAQRARRPRKRIGCPRPVTSAYSRVCGA